MLLRRLGAEPLQDAGAIDQIETGGFDLDDATSVDVDARTTEVSLVDAHKAGLVLSALAAAVREEPKSKVVAIDGGALAIAVKYLADTSAGSAAAASSASAPSSTGTTEGALGFTGVDGG